MRTTRRIIPFALLSGLLLSCGSEHRLARVRISQPGVREATTDTACKVPEQIAWTDDKGERHIVTRAEKDSVTGEEITSVELSEITVMARSKQVAERNGKINLDFVVTVPGELISNKWQLQLAPVAYKPSDTLYLDRIFLSGADFAKMQKRGYMRYQAFINSIIPDSLYLQKLFDGKGYRKHWPNWKRNTSRPGSTRCCRKNAGLTGRTRPMPGLPCSTGVSSRTGEPSPATIQSWSIFPPTG